MHFVQNLIQDMIDIQQIIAETGEIVYFMIAEFQRFNYIIVSLDEMQIEIP